MVDAEQITQGLRRLGVQEGDILLTHSSLSSFGHVEGGAEAVVNALLGAVGKEGTALVPTHTWGTVNRDSPVFDVRRSPSHVGKITEAFRRRDGALRSLHPTHSCAAIGPLKEELLRDHETQITPCGSKSPYYRIMERGGKIAFLGVTQQVNTTCHALEEMACVSYLLDRFERLYCVDYDGKKRVVPSRRHTSGLDRAFDRTEPLLLERGVMRVGRIGDATVRVVGASGMRDAVMPILAEDPFFLLTPQAAVIARSF
ncbi:MAG: AAC(3) family N-acetyltransferase [Planctomycetes bacterium]|nr:AAC(3) family N-acetyltransferase [Planctomycetota bacterium]